MKRLLLSGFLSIGFILSFAQNYECLKPNTKQYFINSFSYLRGMRIDSVSILAAKTIYYPFHSPRGRYVAPMNQPNYVVQALDTNSGSWLGKKVTALQDGTWQFDNYWGDTVIIKSQAQPGDTWMFYNDTTSYYYMATLTSKDTMTILNALDSIKIITLTAYHNAIVNPSDILNGNKIVLSKNHGFAQTVDLYIFPLHEPDIIYSQGFDLFLDNMSYSGPTADNISFKQVEFHNPDAMDLYNYNQGDVFEWHGGVGCSPNERLDSITNKTLVGPNEIQYTINRWTWQYHPMPNLPVTTFSTSMLTVVPGVVMIIDTARMPEESVGYRFYYYTPLDSSQCYLSAIYCNSSNDIYYNNGYFVNTFEPCGSTYRYKNGFGEIDESVCTDPTPCAGQYYFQMTYSDKAGNPHGPCGSFSPITLGVKELVTTKNTISPNPAHDLITVTTSRAPYSLTIYNMLGQPVLSRQCSKQREDIDVSKLPAGIYNIRLQDIDGYYQGSKLLIEH